MYHCHGPLFLEFNSERKLVGQADLKNWGIYNLNRVIIYRVLWILAFKNRFQSLYDEIFNINTFLE